MKYCSVSYYCCDRQRQQMYVKYSKNQSWAVIFFSLIWNLQFQFFEICHNKKISILVIWNSSQELVVFMKEPARNWWFSWKNQQGTGGFHKWSFQNWWVVLTQGYLIGSLIFSKPWLSFIQNYRELLGIFVLLLITGKIWMSIWDGNCLLECKVFFRRNQGPTIGCPNNSYTKFLREFA